MLQKLLIEMENCENVTALTKKVDILDAIHYVKTACSEVSAHTIRKCFINCGFPFNVENLDQIEENITPTQEIAELQNLIRTTCGADVCSAVDLIDIDTNILTENSSTNIEDLVRSNEDNVVVVAEESDELDNKPPIKKSEVFSSLKSLKEYGLQEGLEHFYEKVCSLDDDFTRHAISTRKSKQTSITDFFKQS